MSKCALIIEPRPGPLLRALIRNAFDVLPCDWAIEVFHGRLNAHDVPEHDRVHAHMMDVDNLTILEYCNILTSERFWRRLKYEHVLLLQTDVAISKNQNIDEFLQYDYIGSPWAHHDGEVGNGVSLRRRSAMLRVIPHIVGCTNPEDLVYTDKMRELGGFNFPSTEVAMRFGVETMFYPRPFLIHKPWPYLTRHQLAVLAETKEFRKLLKRHHIIP
jgi:hypothetical protein